MKVTLPYFIPIPFALGTFGAFIQMKSPAEDRRALFDVGIAGPLAGLAVAIPALLYGLQYSTIVTGESAAGMMQGEAGVGSSVLFALLAKLALGEVLTEGHRLLLHPFANVVMDYIVSNGSLRSMMVDKLAKGKSESPEGKVQTSTTATGSSSAQEKGDVIIQFKAGVQAEQIKAMASEIGLREVKKIPSLGLNVCKITSDISIEAVIEHCSKHPFVEYAEPNYMYKTQK